MALNAIKQANKQNKQTIQWPKEKFEDTKEEIRSFKSKKTRQYNDQVKKDNMTNDNLENSAQKTKDRSRRTPLHG